MYNLPMRYGLLWNYYTVLILIAIFNFISKFLIKSNKNFRYTIKYKKD